VVNNTKNMVFDGIAFQYATWLDAGGPKGFVDTQSAYMYRDGEAPVNIHVVKSTNISFTNNEFSHLGAVYALGVDGGSQVRRTTLAKIYTFTNCCLKIASLGNQPQGRDSV
jgi:hypothetical protein